MDVRAYIKNRITFLDGGMGSLLQARGLQPAELPEKWNLTHSADVMAIHKAYFDAGTNIVLTNTFGAYSTKFDDVLLAEIIKAAVSNAFAAKEASVGTQEKFVAYDVGPLGKMLKPYGELEFENAVSIFKKSIEIAVSTGVDLIFIETMNDSLETKAALLAAKETTDLPVFVSNAYGEDGKLMTGATPRAMVAMLEGMHADAIGANCSLGPKQLEGVIQEYLEYASVPVLVKPNAGLPKLVDGNTVYDVTPSEFSEDVKKLIELGVHIAGGCCGTNPSYIEALVNASESVTPVPVTAKNHTLVSSYTHAIEFKDTPVLIGERINPTGKKKFKEALRNGDINYIINEGIVQADKGVHVLDVNVGLPEIDEVSMLKTVTYELQSVCDLPLQIDTTNVVAMEAALREYNGKAMINSVSGKEEVMAQIFPLVKKYGGLLVCLTLDDAGIPETAEQKVEIAKKIIAKAAEYGIAKKDLIFDTLAMAVSADPNAAVSTLKALKTIKYELGCHTSLGISNVSFGLPNREVITSAFYLLALENGLSAAIMNPNSNEMMKAYLSYKALKGFDENFKDYIENTDRYIVKEVTPEAGVKGTDAKTADDCPESPLMKAVIKGLKGASGNLTAKLLETAKPLEIINGHIIPALDVVGRGFENKTMFLPQLLMAAESARCAFDVIKDYVKSEESRDDAPKRSKFVIATVKGDIHDIGKNIVKLVLENYGFEVIDLGKDVPPEAVVNAVRDNHAPMVGLSALMTTTVTAMEDTIKLLKKETPWVKIVVGGAVLTQEYSDKIGADYYGSDAMATVRYACRIDEELQ